MRKYLTIFLFSLCLFACNIAQDIQEMAGKQAEVQKVIKEKYGWDSKVGWQIQNGVLTHVTVILNAEEVKNEKIEALESAAR